MGFIHNFPHIYVEQKRRKLCMYKAMFEHGCGKFSGQNRIKCDLSIDQHFKWNQFRTSETNQFACVKSDSMLSEHSIRAIHWFRCLTSKPIMIIVDFSLSCDSIRNHGAIELVTMMRANQNTSAFRCMAVAVCYLPLLFFLCCLFSVYFICLPYVHAHNSISSDFHAIWVQIG